MPPPSIHPTVVADIMCLHARSILEYLCNMLRFISRTDPNLELDVDFEESLSEGKHGKTYLLTFAAKSLIAPLQTKRGNCQTIYFIGNTTL